MADENEQRGGGITPLLRAPGPMNCSCQNEDLPAWRRPLLTQRKGYRQDGRLGRVRGAYVNGVLTDARDAGRALMEGKVDLCAGIGPGEVMRQNDNIAKTTQPRRKAPRDDAWQWGTERSFGGGGTVRVGPGWGGDEAPRFDAGEVELVIDGRRCFEMDGAWVTAEGEPCPLVEER
jgi:hypothetical protein